MTEAYVFDALRTPRGKGKKDGTLHEVKPIDLLVGLLTELQARHRFDTAAVDDVVMGIVSPVGEQGSVLPKVAAGPFTVSYWKPSAMTSPVARCRVASDYPLTAPWRTVWVLPSVPSPAPIVRRNTWGCCRAGSDPAPMSEICSRTRPAPGTSGNPIRSVSRCGKIFRSPWIVPNLLCTPCKL